MSELFTGDDEEWIEISDAEGHKAALRHLAMIRDGAKIYHILGAFSSGEDGEDESGFLLIREDATADGAQEYVVASDEDEIERVVGGFVLHALSMFVAAQEDADDDVCEACGERHAPGEFCVCGDPELLQ